MSEEGEVVEGQESEQQEQQQEQVKFDPDTREAKLVEKAAAQGWKTFEEHVEAGGDPEAWRPAGEFLLYGEMTDKIKSFEQGFENRAKRLDKYYQAQLKAQRLELEERLEQAAENGDKAAVSRINKQIVEHEKLEQENPTAQGQQTPPELDEWNRNNKWVNDPTPKASHARTVFAQALQAGNTVAAALKIVDAEVARHFPPKPSGHVPGSESGKNKGFQRQDRKLTWSDLRQDELKAYEATKSAWKSPEQFLKAAQDARKAEEKE